MDGAQPGAEERARRQSSVLLLLAGFALLGTIIAGIWLLVTLASGRPSLRVHSPPSPAGAGYRIAEGTALGADWTLELTVESDGPAMRFSANGSEVVRRTGLVPTADRPVTGDGAVRFPRGEETRVVILFGTVAPGVTEILIESAGRDANVRIIDLPRESNANVRAFVAVLEAPGPIDVVVRDRTGRTLSEGVLAEPLSGTF